MSLNLDIPNILILIVAMLNIAYGAIIYFKDKENKTSYWFFLLTLSVGLWGISMFFFRSINEEYLAGFFARILYFSAAAIPISFVYFVLVFPNALIKLNFRQKYIFPLPFLIITLISFAPDLLIRGTEIVKGEETRIIFGVFYHTIYVLYINIFFIYGYFLLIKKYFATKTQDSVVSKQIVYIIAGTLTSTLIGLSTNLIGPYVGIFTYNWVGQIATIIMISAIAYAILKYQLFNIKLILVELAILLLNLFLFINIFTFHSKTDFMLNTSVFTFIFLFSIVLIRGIHKDIRDRERIFVLAKEMEIANDRMRMMEGQKTEFVSIASHQLRTPLTVIKGYASMILEGTFGTISAEVRDAVEKLYKSSERIVALVEDLLTVSRIEQGRMMLVFETVDFKEFIQKVLEEIRAEIEDSKLELSFTIEDGGDFRVHLDEKKFKQVLAHIIENAIKYTKAPGKIRIFLTEDDVTNKVRFSISDTGTGMTQAQIYGVFERFNLKADLTAAGMEKEASDKLESEKIATGESAVETKESAESEMMKKRTPGIGLYIAQEIIEAHHGELRIESAGTDRGTTVIVELPKVEEAAQ